MLEALARNEAAIRLGAFLAVLALMSFWEVLAPRRPAGADRLHRWPANLGILLADTLMLRLFFPVLAAGVGLWAQQADFGLFNAVDLPFWTEAGLSLVLLDLTLYVQHVLFHYVPVLWRVHRVHHIDTHVDATTGLRFHPVEIALSMALKMGVVAALGVAPEVVILFEVLLNAASLFNHGNVHLPLGTDGAVRLLVVTPDMHRVHHSVIPRETNSNFGFGLSIWDRLFRTYWPQPQAGHEGMDIGQAGVGPETAGNLWRILAFPFRRGS